MSSVPERRYKTLFGIAKATEISGWLMCLTVILIPFGILFIYLGQAVLVVTSIEDNTRRSLKLLEIIAAKSGGTGSSGGISQALKELSDGGESINDQALLEDSYMQCPGCGNEVSDADDFCCNCGFKLLI